MVRRIASLDSLRGVAAFAVVIAHCVQMQGAPETRWGPVPLRWAELMGKEAVQVFFVLSGFVLFLSFRGNDRFAYPPYVVKRFARIYLPFAVAILLSALLMALVQPQPVPAFSDWFNVQSWSLPPTPGTILAHLAMTDRADWQTLDNVMWSLVHEMRISLIFPVLALAMVRRWRLTLIVATAISVLSMALVHRFEGAAFNPLSTLSYLWLFAAGAAMAMHHVELREWMRRRSERIRALALLATGLILASPLEALENITTPVGAIAAVFLCFADPSLERLLHHRIPEWLGRVSYSLYLIHVPILLTLGHLLYGRIPMPLLLVMIVSVALIAAEIMYRLVEEPTIALGRRVAQSLAMRRFHARRTP